MLAFSTFIASPLGTLILKIVEGIAILGALFGLYMLITTKAADTQIQKDQVVILNQVVANQKAFIEKQAELAEASRQANDDLTKQITEVKDANDEIRAYLNNPDTIKEDRGSSDILKNTIKSLSGEK